MNPLQRAATIRKASYLGAILVLFTVSLYWRGVIPLPLRLSAASAAAPFRWAGNHTIESQAQRLEVWELNPEESEAEVVGSALRLTLTGSRGFVVTGLWLSAIDKQRRNDFHEFEQRVQAVTKLQPNFITPWIFQSWNIAYNVSVEMHGSGDMYFYIARGIELLAKGERQNRRSPDMRYQIAFYYQNKFGVSDQVEVLRCLFDLSCIPPEQRDPRRFVDPETKKFRYDVFESFCQDYPHLVRRLRGEDQRYTDKKAAEKLRRATPQEVVQFLETNYEVPSRYRVVYRVDGTREYKNELADKDKQFPALPDQFTESNEAHPKMETKTELSTAGGYFTAFKAARAWFSYSLLLLPPQIKDAQGQPVPGPTPRAGQFGHDPAKHRVPRLPAMVIFRQGAPRAQSYQAEMEQKEGWFDEEGWLVDDPTAEPSKLWFADDPDRPSRPKGVVAGAGRAWSLVEWQKAAELWNRHGADYGLYVDPARYQTLRAQATDPGSIPGDLTQDQYNDEDLRKRYVAKTALDYYASNRQVTNFPYFVAAANAEQKRETVAARKALYKAELARKIGNPPLAIQLYKNGLDQWKEVLRANPTFHRPERSDRTEEETCEFEMAYQRLLVQDDERVREYADRLAGGSQSVVPFLSLPFPMQDKWYQSQLDQRRKQWAAELKQWEERQRTRKPDDKPDPRPEEPRVEADPLWPSGNREELKWYVVENVSGQSFSSPFVGSMAPDGGPWVSDSMKESVRQKQGVSRKQPAGIAAGGAPQPGAGPQEQP
ncbi:hypothetical protein R5W24_004569 [Gemmata sp. JC717]|uniref:hypothetical protein n=1 Tax=Gemmata algarum TaxID=2975278 RepID=UPI0021BAF4BE|nr:hypothetical protein [Gemmata algarum]MDY3555426.1 hypothetical protein [Gemmata algarum]